MKIIHPLTSLIMRQVYHRGLTRSGVIFLASFCVLSFGLSLYLCVSVGQGQGVTFFRTASAAKGGELKVSFLDIGQGDSILIQAPNGNSFLIDSGPVGGKVLTEISKQKSFFDTYVDVLLITHGDADHIGSMIDVLQKYSSGLFLYSGINAPTSIYKNLVEYVQTLNDRQALKNLLVMDGMKIILDEDAGVYFEILFPNFLYELNKYGDCAAKFQYKIVEKKKVGLKKSAIKSSIKSTSIKLKSTKSKAAVVKPAKNVFSSCRKFLQLETNENSIVGKLTYGSTSFMLTGDAPIVTEQFLIDQSNTDTKTAALKKSGGSEDLHADVLKLGHHGSRTSTSEEFLKAVAPGYVVISSGKDNRYGHPHVETLERVKTYFEKHNMTVKPSLLDFEVSEKSANPTDRSLASTQIFRTDTSGTITFISNGAHLSVESEKPD